MSNKNVIFAHIKIYLLNTVIIILLFTSDYFPQNTFSLFKEFIPQKILNNKDILNGLAYKFEVQSEIHPALIYYQIEYLKNLYKDKAKINNSVLNRILNQRREFYIQKRTDWAKLQIEKVNKDYNNFARKNKITSYFNNLISNIRTLKHHDKNLFIPNKNMLNYIILKYITKDTSLKFDSTKNYYQTLFKTQNDLLKHLSNLTFKNNITVNNDILTSVQKYWFIFNDSLYQHKKDKNYLDAYQILYNIFKNFSQNNKFSIQIGYTSIATNFKQKIPVKISSTKGNPQRVNTPTPELPIELTLKHVAGLFSFRFFLKNEPTYLSYITFQFIAAFSTNKNFHSKNFDEQKTTEPNTVETTKYSYEYTVLTNNNYTLKISTPAYIVNNMLFFEIALNTSLRTMTSSFDYDYYYSKRNQYPLAHGFGYGRLPTDDQFLHVYPTIDIIYKPYDNIKTSLSANHEYFAFFIGYSF